MTLLVNGVYPLDYFRLQGVDQIKYPDQFWWSSKQRFAAESPSLPGTYLPLTAGGEPTSEYLEIDLGRVRAINYISFDALRVPVDITVEYDQVSSIDGDHKWVSVQRREDMEFTESLSYDANNRNAWYHAQYYFTDTKGNMVNTRYIRMRFKRRDEAWPVAGAEAFRWPVMVKAFRSGRYITRLTDSQGILVSQPLHDLLLPGTPGAATATVLAADGSQNATKEIRQRFTFPSNTQRGGIVPDMLGFGFLLKTNILTFLRSDQEIDALNEDFSPHSWEWKLYQIVYGQPDVLLKGGVETHVVNEGQTWLDFFLPDGDVIPGSMTTTYELRVRSLNPTRSNTIYTTSPAVLSTQPLQGTFTFTNGSATANTTSDLRTALNPGDFISRADTPSQTYQVSSVTATTVVLTAAYHGTSGASVSVTRIDPMSTWDVTSGTYQVTGTSALQMRVWANIGDEGRDVLGNSYRYGLHKDAAANVFDKTKAGWMSAPQPAPDAVEALYFDVRHDGPDATGKVVKKLSVVDAIRIAPRTPGVRMYVYTSTGNLNGAAPDSRDSWDNLIWEPINVNYVLRNDAVIELPHPVKASFIKLEFTNLRPLPYRIPNYPALPPQQYRRYPTWVEQQFRNTQVRQAVESWFIQNVTPIQQKVLSTMSDPVQEFQYKEREFLAALSLGKVTDSAIVNSGLVDSSGRTFIDPVTAAKIFVPSTDDFQSTLLVNVDRNSLLGQVVTDRYDPDNPGTPFEASPSTTVQNVPLVSTGNNRITESYSLLAQTPMRFNVRTRHEYRIDAAEFNKKAYFVGVDSVQFLRNRYTQVHDNNQIIDTLYDDDFLVSNTWERESQTSIPNRATVYVCYEVNGVYYEDEPILLEDFLTTTLAGTGGQAINVRVFVQPGRKGGEYFSEWDFDLHYDLSPTGVLINSLSRVELAERLTAPKLQLVYQDFGVAVGRAFIPTEPIIDAAVVSSTAVPINTYDGIWRDESGTIIGHGTAPGSDIFEMKDAGTVTGSGSTSATDFDASVDGGTTSNRSTGRAIPSTTAQTFDAVDIGTVTGTAQALANISGLMGQGVVGRTGTTFGDLRLATTDADTASGTAVPSATGSYTPNGGSPTPDP